MQGTRVSPLNVEIFRPAIRKPQYNILHKKTPGELGDGNYTVAFDVASASWLAFDFVGPDGNMRNGEGFYAHTITPSPVVRTIGRLASFHLPSRHCDLQIAQRLFPLSILEKRMDFKAIFGEVNNILFNNFKLDPSRCRGFMPSPC